MRRAMTLRTAVCGMRWSPGAVKIGCAAGAAGRGAAFGAAAGAAAGAPGFALSTSAFTIRPFGPEPLRLARSTPLSAAMRLASGDAKMRWPLEAVAAAGCGVAFGGGAEAAFGAGAASALG